MGGAIKLQSIMKQNKQKQNERDGDTQEPGKGIFIPYLQKPLKARKCGRLFATFYSIRRKKK
jgi:hypothetical protein